MSKGVNSYKAIYHHYNFTVDSPVIPQWMYEQHEDQVNKTWNNKPERTPTLLSKYSLEIKIAVLFYEKHWKTYWLCCAVLIMKWSLAVAIKLGKHIPCPSLSTQTEQGLLRNILPINWPFRKLFSNLLKFKSNLDIFCHSRGNQWHFSYIFEDFSAK